MTRGYPNPIMIQMFMELGCFEEVKDNSKNIRNVKLRKERLNPHIGCDILYSSSYP